MENHWGIQPPTPQATEPSIHVRRTKRTQKRKKYKPQTSITKTILRLTLQLLQGLPTSPVPLLPPALSPSAGHPWAGQGEPAVPAALGVGAGLTPLRQAENLSEFAGKSRDVHRGFFFSKS